MVFLFIVGCIVLLILLIILYFKYVKMKQHFYLLDVACVYALYTLNNKDKRLNVALIMTILNLFKISLEKHYVEEICIHLERLDNEVTTLRTIESTNDKVFNKEQE